MARFGSFRQNGIWFMQYITENATSFIPKPYRKKTIKRPPNQNYVVAQKLHK